MIHSHTKFTATILTASILAACGGGNSGTTSSPNATTGTTGKSYNSFVKSDSTFEVKAFQVITDYENGTTTLDEVNEAGVANMEAKTITFTNEGDTVI